MAAPACASRCRTDRYRRRASLSAGRSTHSHDAAASISSGPRHRMNSASGGSAMPNVLAAANTVSYCTGHDQI